VSGRLFAIGDVHGCSSALDTLLELVEPTPEDTLIFLGDYVDRGPDARGVLDRLVELSKRENFVALRGNHDLWMLNARQDREWRTSWLDRGVGGMATLDSYKAQSFKDIPDSHWEFLENTKLYFETEKFIFTHAGIDGELDLKDQSEEALLWRRVTACGPHYSGRTLICGHTAQKKGVPLDLGHAICIDTWAYGKGFLSCLDCEHRYLWQASQEGEVNEGWLDNFTA
jgi:serine/threonine protein phosphatase 1